MPNTDSTVLKLPKYSPTLFVNRQVERDFVVHKAQSLTQGRTLDKRTVIFIGQRGVGKTWLLSQLYSEDLRTVKNLTTIFIRMQEYTDQEPHQVIIEILNQISRELLGQEIASGLKPAELSRELFQELQPLLTKQTLVLLVDSVYESNWDILAALEDYILGPLAVEPQVLIVLAGRGRPYPWKTPELRLKADFYDLTMFTEKDTKAQLEKQNEEAIFRSVEIHSLSGGNPLANFWLATQPDRTQALDRAIDGVLETVPEKDTRRHKLRHYLEALAVLRAFDEERIPTMLAAYYGDSRYAQWEYPQSRQVREEIVKWAFARWDEEQGGYVIHESIRELLRHYLKTKPHIQKWQTLQCAAYRLYNEWMDQYTRTKDRWAEEAQYHQAELGQAGFNPKDCSNSNDQTVASTATVSV